MSDTNETRADILREMRNKAAEVDGKLVAGAAAWFRDFADRIEAAAKRELSRAAEDAASKATLDRTAKDAAEYLAYAMARNSAPEGNAVADRAKRFAQYCTRYPGTGCMLRQKKLYNCSECRWAQMPYEGKEESNG